MRRKILFGSLAAFIIAVILIFSYTPYLYFNWPFALYVNSHLKKGGDLSILRPHRVFYMFGRGGTDASWYYDNPVSPEIYSAPCHAATVVAHPDRGRYEEIAACQIEEALWCESDGGGHLAKMYFIQETRLPVVEYEMSHDTHDMCTARSRQGIKG